MLAAAKINLDLRITGRRDDGYHLLDSIVVFADIGDELTVERHKGLTLEISGPFSDGLDCGPDNLIMKAAQLFFKETAISPKVTFKLVKNLPVSSGIGGGSADAAAAIRLLLDLYKPEISQQRIMELALEIGADVPVCLQSYSAQMCGIGERITPITIADDIYMLLVNPLKSVSTADVFKAYANSGQNFEREREIIKAPVHIPLMLDILKDSTNSLEQAACAIESDIGEILKALDKTEGALISRMSGSGATCFSLYQTKEECTAAALKMRKFNKSWWVRETKII
ncbi:MAG: 4-(cytidine 5'-diphospho)-2-C-methyl-D-erythritol kinase [Alphaproteobacteria bacterium]|nr:4-(cytidine 5'-diphospho)-2-C-methyl-D-erythritol kinase [Alphaproteobacteria bacterium]